MKKKKFSALGMAGVALLLALTVAMSGCSFTGRRGPSSSSDSSASDEDAGPDREEVPDDDDPGDVPDDNPDSPSDAPDSSSQQEPSSSGDSSQQAPAASSSASSSQRGGNPAPAPSASSAPAAASSAPSAPAASGSAPSKGSSASSSSASSKQDKPASSASQAAGTLKNVTYVQKGAYTKQEKFQNASVRGSGMLIRNKTFYGDMTITSKAGDDGITLQDVDIKGTLTVQGGSDWLKLYGCSVGDLVVDYQGAKVFASQNTSVGSVTVKQDATLQEGELTGSACGFEDIEVSGEKGETLDLILKNLDTNKLTTRTDAVVETDKDSQIDIFNARAATRIKGAASIGELTAYEDGVYYDKDHRPDKLYTSGGADRPRPYGSSSSKDEDAYDSSKKDVSIEPIDNISVERGEEYTVWVESNARKLTASSSDRTVASVSVGADEDELIITGKKVGKAVITVKGTRSGYNADTEKFTVEVVSNREEAPAITIQSGDPAAWTNQDVTVSFRVTDTDLYEVKAGGQTWRNNQTNYSFTVKNNGTYSIEAVDAKGNTSKAAVNITHIDKEPPQLSGLAAAGLNVSFKLSDTGSGVNPASVQVRNSDGAVFPPMLKDGVYRFTGEYGKTYQILAADKAGNVYQPSNQENPENQITLQADQKPVISSAPVVADADVYRQQKAVSFAVTYPQGMAPTVQYAFKGASSSPLQTVTTSDAAAGYKVSFYSFIAVEQGEYTVIAKNTAGEISDKVQVGKIDSVAPVIGEPKITDIQVGTSAAKQVSLPVTDDASGIKLVTAKLGDTSAIEASAATDGTYSFTALKGGVYLITAADKAGNVSGKQVTVADPAAPVTPPTTTPPTTNPPTADPPATTPPTTDPPATTPPAADAVPVIGDLQYFPEQNKDIELGSKQVYFRVTNVEAAEIASVTTEDNRPITPQSDGSYWFSAIKPQYTVTVTTRSGKTASRIFTIEKLVESQPVAAATITGSDPTGWTAGNAVVQFTVSSATPVTKVTITGGIIPQKSGDSYSFEAADIGTYTVTVENGSAAPATKDFHVTNIDRKPVTVSVLNEAELGEGAGNTLEKTVRFSVDAGESMAAGKVTVTPAPKSDPVLENGVYSFKVNANTTYTIQAQNGAGAKGKADIPVNSIGPNEAMINTSAQDPAADKWAKEKRVSFTVSDPALIPTVSGPSGSAVAVSGSAGSYSFGAAQNGKYTISISYAGKTASKTAEVSHIDTQAPAAPYLYKQDAPQTPCDAALPIITSTQAFQVFVPSQEAGQSPVTTEYSLDNGKTWMTVPLRDAKNPALGYQLLLPALPTGTQEKAYTLRLRARDAAENSSEVTYQITLRAPAAAGDAAGADAPKEEAGESQQPSETGEGENNQE